MKPCCLGEFTLRYESKPWTHNAERRMSRWERAALVKDWRLAFRMLAIQAGVPDCDWMHVVAVPYQQRGVLQDVSACHPAVKAAIDGLVDAGVVPDDDGEHVPFVLYKQARRGSNALALIVGCHRGEHHGVRLDLLGGGGHHDAVPDDSDVVHRRRGDDGGPGEGRGRRQR